MDADELFATPEVERLLEALTSLSSVCEARALLLDLCTVREIEDFAQRLEVARLLDNGESYLAVSEHTGASSTTVSRVSKCLNGQAGGYRLVLDRAQSSQTTSDEH